MLLATDWSSLARPDCARQRHVAGKVHARLPLFCVRRAEAAALAGNLRRAW